MKISSLQEFDASEVVCDTEILAEYLRLAFETGCERQIKRALCACARARGRESLEETLLQEERLTLELTLVALKQLGIRLVPASVRLAGQKSGGS